MSVDPNDRDEYMQVRFPAIALAVLLAATTVGADESPCAKVQAQLRTVAAAIEVYHLQYGACPAEAGWMAVLKRSGILAQGFPERDPWDHPFAFKHRGSADFDLRSIGPDGKWGSDDDQLRLDGYQWKVCTPQATGCGGC